MARMMVMENAVVVVVACGDGDGKCGAGGRDG